MGDGSERMAGCFDWTFVQEQPQKSSAKSSAKARQPQNSSRPPEACTNCQTTKVKCRNRSVFELDCDRCQRKGLNCVRKQSTRFTQESQTHIVIPEDDPKVKLEKHQGVVRKALNSVQQVTTYVASGLYSMLENKLNGILAMGGASHIPCVIAFCLLRREVDVNWSKNEPYSVELEGHWFYDGGSCWPAACKKVLAVGDALCARAHRSLCRDPAIMQRNCLWIPAHLPQLHGPDAVFITTGILGKVSKYTNHAWNRHFRNVDEMHDLMQTLTTPQPLAEVGLFPLIGVIPAASQREVTNKYFWDFILRTDSSTVCDASSAAEFTSRTEFTSDCDDKFGNAVECLVTVYTCFQHEGAVFIRVIRCMPVSRRLESQARSPPDITVLPRPVSPAVIEADTPQSKRQKLMQKLDSGTLPEVSDVPVLGYNLADSLEASVLPCDEFAYIDDDLTLSSILSFV